MKRYLLFAFDQHYPSGGWSDFKDDFDEFDDAKREGEQRIANGRDHFQVVDTESMKIVHDVFLYRPSPAII